MNYHREQIARHSSSATLFLTRLLGREGVCNQLIIFRIRIGINPFTMEKIMKSISAILKLKTLNVLLNFIIQLYK